MHRILLICIALWTVSVQADSVRVGVLAHVTADAADDEQALREALARAEAADPAFVLVHGLKDRQETCRDSLFRRRKAILEAAELPVFLSMAGSDWLGCRDRRGRPASLIWLNLLRDQLYGNISWSGSKHIDLKRQSSIPAFRSYAENTRWYWQDILFASLHLPAENNHYVAAAGSNSEFEDRLTANRYWLKRLAAHARSAKTQAVVIFTDGQVLPAPNPDGGKRDGFAEIRRALTSFSDKLALPVLLVQTAPQGGANDLLRSGKLYYASLSPGVHQLAIDTSAEHPFSIDPAHDSAAGDEANPEAGDAATDAAPPASDR